MTIFTIVAAIFGTALGLALARGRARKDPPPGHARDALEAAVTKRTEQLQEELNRASRLATVGQLVAGVGHEINNPLAYVVTNLELLTEQLGEQEDELVHASLVDARDGVERIRQIVRDLQAFSRTDEAGQHTVDLNQILERCLRMANTQIRHAARLTVNLGAVPTISANETRLGQVFLNLLINATQAIGEGRAAENEIHIRSFTDSNGRAVVEIKDSGPGISAETCSRIFDPFFTTKPVGQGTGLGLSICQSIVRALDGTIEAVSELGTGALFRVILPPAKVRRERKASAPLAPSIARRRVLVIDDEPLICASIKKALGEHDVVTEIDSRRALEQLRSGARYDIIFCDLMMPEMNGIDVYEALRTSAPDTISRIVFMSGGVLNDRTRGFVVGNPNRFMDKPLRAKSLRRLVIESAPLQMA